MSAEPVTLASVVGLYAIASLTLEVLALEHRRAAMPRVRAFGQEFNAEIVKDNGDGTYLMKALERTGRTARGGTFTAEEREIIPISGHVTGLGEVPPGSTMTRPSTWQPARVPCAPFARTKILDPATPGGDGGLQSTLASGIGHVPSEADQRGIYRGLKLTPSKPMHLADKLKALSDGAKSLAADVEAQADAALAKQDAVKTRLANAFSNVQSVIADAEAGVTAVEEAMKGLTN